ncbi:MAG: type II toxin-antitoxin system VapC family toxin [Thermoplasmataceae archaeon]
MNYIDTNIIIAYLNVNDVNHPRASKAMNQLDDKVTSQIGLMELRSVLSRTTNLNEDEIEAYVDYLATIKIDVPEVDINKIFRNAAQISYKIKMRTLNTLHLSVSMMVNAHTFVTLDREFLEKKSEISGIGIEIHSP